MPRITGGYITKAYKGVSNEVQIKFLRDLMLQLEDGGDISRVYPLVSVALALSEPRLTEREKLTKCVVLQNPRLRTNARQLEVLSAMLNGSSIELVWGPPGTGKTTLAAELTYQDWTEGITTLVVAHTNRAADNLLLAAKAAGAKVYRVGNHLSAIDPKLRENWIYKDRPQAPREPEHWDPDDVNEQMITEHFAKEFPGESRPDIKVKEERKMAASMHNQHVDNNYER
jgi:hypothetical protein